MTLQQIKESARKEFDEKFCIECPEGTRKGDIVLNPIYPQPIQDFIDSLIDKAYEEGKMQTNTFERTVF